MRRRQAIRIELHERIRRIQLAIKEEQDKIDDIELRIQLKQEDLEFHRALLHELEVDKLAASEGLEES
jgi:hypothetical protein